MSAFGERLVDALSLWIELGDGAHIAEGDWEYRLVTFLGYHRNTAPDYSRNVAKFILEVHRRGSFPDESWMRAFIDLKGWWDARWVNANDVYEYFGVNTTPGSGGVVRVGPSLDARTDTLPALLHPHSVREGRSLPQLSSKSNHSTVWYDDGGDGTQSERRASASNALSTSGTLQAQRTDSHSNAEPRGGQESVTDHDLLPRDEQIHLEGLKVSTIRSTSSNVVEEEINGMEGGQERASELESPTSAGQNAEDTLDRTLPRGEVPSLSQNRLVPRVGSQHSDGGQADATNNVLIRADVEHDNLTENIGDDAKSSLAAEEG
ncbi:hypothetical protein PUNSTDRAFT_133511 [Punctularia strigosozonata HHB-11173 SS5]|uniref:uncharacterized protein n=1 Tax=Punctularia strigosozonata (strain HHB-11173) TaxID=741275 RepID=UPI0004417AD8|nr:uncharacterized protein PUNSTDRAFT_133511 [Punctularia strigosozonata HHB-11173 SS5]EIN09741.1 hypothetical protein PUNSTDRAFT_133511 [Punctularia strigosozonata HHB-11173 SS5]